MSFLRRYIDDPSRPTVAQAGVDLSRRTLLPAMALWAAIVAVGLLLVGPLGSLPDEVGINRALEVARTPLWNTLTSVSSHVGGTQLVVVAALAGEEFHWKDALINAAVLTVGSWFIFIWGLKLTIPLWPSFITG